MSDTDLTLPSWFLRIMALCAGLLTAGGVPWAAWVTWAMIDLQSSAKAAETTVTRIAALERSQQDHVSQLQIVAATRFTSEHGRLLTAGLETRLDRLETKVDTTNTDLASLRREFDRTFGKPAGTGSNSE